MAIAGPAADSIAFPPSWYAATLENAFSSAALSGLAEADVCVVGGGFAGLHSARALARGGRSVVLLEARRIGWGASGRNGGFVSAGFAEGLDGITARVGPARADALFRMSMEGVDHVRADIASLDPSLKMGDGWIVALRHPGLAGLEAGAAQQAARFGRRLRVLDQAGTRALLRSPRYYAAQEDAGAFHIHPLNYAHALARAAAREGVRIHEASPAKAAARRGGVWEIATPAGHVRARHVVWCVSAYDRAINPALGRAVLPVATYIGVTEPLGGRGAQVIATGAAISDTRRAGDYYRLLPEDRILWGGRITTRISEPGRLAAMMRGDMLSVYPQLGHPRMEYAWGGLMGYALHRMPIIGRIGEDAWAATAFGGHGLNTTAMAGLLIGEAIAQGSDRWRQFAEFGPRWAGGPFGRAGVQLTYWGMQARDRFDEARARMSA